MSIQVSAKNLKAQKMPDVMAYFKTRTTREKIEKAVKVYNEFSSIRKTEFRDGVKEFCDEFFKTEEYKSGDDTLIGYSYCCDLAGFCGGVSGWIIFLIIVLILGMCAAGAAAFWFFYWKRKNGGKEEIEENSEDTDKTIII